VVVVVLELLELEPPQPAKTNIRNAATANNAYLRGRTSLDIALVIDFIRINADYNRAFWHSDRSHAPLLFLVNGVLEWPPWIRTLGVLYSCK
jgi:hypothetical protein